MNTRYYEMIIWSLTFGMFSLLITGAYYQMNKYIKSNGYHSVKGHICLSDIVILTALISIVSVRCNCGSDYYNYYLMYNLSTSWYHSLTEIMTSKFQNGYMALSYIVKSSIGWEFAIFGAIACIVYTPVIYLIRKRLNHQTEAFALWIFLGFFSMTLNIIKQSLAMACILMAYDCMQRRRYLRYFVFSLLACFFHISCIYVVVIIVLSQYKWNIKKIFKILFLFSVSAALLITPFLITIQKVLPENYKHYVDYFLSEEISKDYKLQLGALVVTVTFLVLLWEVVCRSFEIFRMNKYCLNMIKIMVFTMPFLVLGIRFFLLNRVAYEAFQFLPFVFSEYLYIGKKKKHTFLWILMFIFCAVTSVLCGENNYYNYSTIFNDIPCTVKQFAAR